jgi:hypothetical protein
MYVIKMIGHPTSARDSNPYGRSNKRGDKKVTRIGFKPMACCLEGSCSIQLSYRVNTSTAGKNKKKSPSNPKPFSVPASTCRLLFTFGQTIATIHGRKDRR